MEAVRIETVSCPLNIKGKLRCRRGFCRGRGALQVARSSFFYANTRLGEIGTRRMQFDILFLDKPTKLEQETEKENGIFTQPKPTKRLIRHVIVSDLVCIDRVD